MPKPITGKPTKDKATPKQVKKMTGVFLAQNLTLEVVEGKNRSLRLSLLSDGKWARQPGRFVRRADGAFWSTKTPGASVSVVKAWGRTYLTLRGVGGTGTFRTHATLGQRMRSGAAVSPTWQGRVGRKWLLANEDPSSLNWTNAGTPAVDVATIPGLSGYLLAEGALVESVPFDATASDSRGTMFLEVPLVPGRDLYDLDFSTQGGEEFLTFSSSVLRPAATVPSLSGGSSAVTIGARGLVEWYRVPSASRVTISGQSDWKLFDDTCRYSTPAAPPRRRSRLLGRGLPGGLRPGGEHRDGAGRVGRVRASRRAGVGCSRFWPEDGVLEPQVP